MTTVSPSEPEAPPAGWVLDASALLAFLRAEPGGDQVPELLERAVVSSVNWSEVVQKAVEHGVATSGMREDFAALGLEILPFDALQAERTALLRPETRHLGLSLGDRACLALALLRGWPAVTTDHSWEQLQLDVAVRALR